MTENTTSTDSDQDDVDADGSTTDTETRYWLTNDLLAIWLLVTFPLLVGAGAYGLVDLSALSLNVSYAYLLLVLGAGTWVFGVRLIEAWAGGE